jgi:hypothetical protein
MTSLRSHPRLTHSRINARKVGNRRWSLLAVHFRITGQIRTVSFPRPWPR